MRTRRAPYRQTIVLLATTVVVLASILATPMKAWARSGVEGAETNIFATHILGAPPTSSCSGLAILSISLSWTAPSDASYVLGYEVGSSTSSGGPYSYGANLGNVFSTTVSILTGTTYLVVRSVNHNWFGSTTSPQRKAIGVLTLLATCS